MRAVAGVTGLSVRFKLGSSEQLVRELEAGRIDVMAGVLHAESRTGTLAFTLPHLALHYSIFVKGSTHGITEVEDLRRRTVAVERDSIMHRHLAALGFLDHLLLVDTEGDILPALVEGRCEAVVVPRLQTQIQIREKGWTGLHTVGRSVLTRDLCMAVPKGREDLRRTLDEGLAILARTGRQREIQLQWLGQLDSEPGFLRRHLWALTWAFGALLAAAGGVLAWSWALRRQVALRTRQLRRELQERGRAEKALRESQEHFHQIADSIHEVFWTMDFPPGEHASGRVGYLSPAFEAVWGIPVAEVIADPARRLEGLSLEDRARVEAGIQDCLAGRDMALEYCLHRADGEIRWIHDRARPFREPGGQIRRIGGIAEDITERKRSEENLLQSQKLESLGLLAGGIAHDFNNLLTALVGNLNLVEMNLPSESPARPFLDRAERTLQRAAELTRQMLAYSGKGHFVIRALDLNAVVQEMTHLIAVSIHKRVTLSLDLAPDLPPVQADPAQLQQVVLNLLTNANEAIGDQDGVITLATARCDLAVPPPDTRFPGGPFAPGTYAVLTVTDTGCGMSEEIRQRLFDPFFTTKFHGRGLGLSALLGILRGHRGGILIQSEPGAGSVFRLLFPGAPGASAPPEPEAPEPEASRAARVLVVDDEDDVRRATSGLLEALGHRALQARDGLEALERLEGVDLVILDLTMPRMDGRQALQAILDRHPGVRVAISSGYDESEAMQDLAGDRLVGFLPKPYRLKDLKALLDCALRFRGADGTRLPGS